MDVSSTRQASGLSGQLQHQNPEQMVSSEHTSSFSRHVVVTSVLEAVCRGERLSFQRVTVALTELEEERDGWGGLAHSPRP